MINRIINTFGTRVISAALNLLITVIISQFLGPEGKGEQGLIIATIAYILVFSNLMGGGAIVYLVPRHSYSLIMIPAYMWSVLMSSVFFLILAFTNLVDAQFVFNICALSVINAFTSINSTILIGKEKIKTSNLIAFVQPLVITIGLLIFFFVLKIKTIDAYITSLYFSFGVAFLVSLLFVFKYCEKFILHSFAKYWLIIKELVRYGILNQLAHIFQLISFRMSYYWLEDLYSKAEVGIYSNGTSLVESIWLVSRSISLVQYARIANTDDKAYSQRLTLDLTKAGIIISFLLLLVMVFLPPSFYQFIYGPKFGDVAIVIRTLAPGVLFFNIALIVGHYFSGTGKYHVNTISSFIGLLISLALFSFMIPMYNIMGAGIATSISYTATSIVVMIYFVNESKMKWVEFLPRVGDISMFVKEIRKSILHSKKQ